MAQGFHVLPILRQLYQRIQRWTKPSTASVPTPAIVTPFTPSTPHAVVPHVAPSWSTTEVIKDKERGDAQPPNDESNHPKVTSDKARRCERQQRIERVVSVLKHGTVEALIELLPTLNGPWHDDDRPGQETGLENPPAMTLHHLVRNPVWTTTENDRPLDPRLIDVLDTVLRTVPVNALNERQRTALHIASAQGMGVVVQRLIERRARLDLEDDEGSSPLHLAVANRRCDTVDVLLAAGADPNVRSGTSAPPPAKAWETTPLLMLTNRDVSNTHEVMRIGNALIKAGADVNASNCSGLTPLENVVLMHPAKPKSNDLIPWLIMHGADPHARPSLLKDSVWELAHQRDQHLRSMLAAGLPDMDAAVVAFEARLAVLVRATVEREQAHLRAVCSPEETPSPVESGCTVSATGIPTLPLPRARARL